jgi:hypothetical protein
MLIINGKTRGNNADETFFSATSVMSTKIVGFHPSVYLFESFFCFPVLSLLISSLHVEDK